MLTLQFIPYVEIEHLNSKQRIDKLLDIVKLNKIIVLQGRLEPNEESDLIAQTMAAIDQEFKGIELQVIFPEGQSRGLLHRVKSRFVDLLLGSRNGLTIIGPATVVKEIKNDPEKIQLFTEDIVGATDDADHLQDFEQTSKEALEALGEDPIKKDRGPKLLSKGKTVAVKKPADELQPISPSKGNSKTKPKKKTASKSKGNVQSKSKSSSKTSKGSPKKKSKSSAKKKGKKK